MDHAGGSPSGSPVNVPICFSGSHEFRAVAARANYLAADRADIQYSVKEICRKMAKPEQGDWQKFVRLGRYLKGVPRCVIAREWQDECKALSGCSDI